MVETPCIETTYARDKRGYGKCKVTRFGKKIYLTHVLAWVDAHGQLPPPETPCVLHRCDNPPCVRVDHLFVGTKGDNNRDMTAKGRHWQQQKSVCPRCGSNYTPLKSGKGRYCKSCDEAWHRTMHATDEYRERNRERQRLAKRKVLDSGSVGV